MLHSTCSWSVHVLPNGDLEIGTAQTKAARGDGSPVQQIGSPVAQTSDKLREFSLTQTYISGTESTSVGIPVIGGADINATDPAEPLSKTFKVALEVEGIEGPQVEIGKAQVYEKKTWTAPFFEETNVKVRPEQRAQLLAWYFGLSKRTRRRLKAGKLAEQDKLKLDAYASTTGKAPKNQLDYARGRKNAIQQILGGPDRFVADDAWIATAWGEDKPPDAKPGDDPAEERRSRERPDPSRLIAQLEVWDDVTPGVDSDDPFE